MNNESTKSIKSTKLNKYDSDTESDAKSEQNSDTDSDEETQLEKLGISKSELIKINAKTKDCCSHWYHKNSKSVYSFNMKERKWKKGNKQICEFLEDEIAQIENNLKTKTIKSTKSTKSNKKFETELDENNNKNTEKKNKSKSQQSITYKEKAMLNSKYVDEDSEDSEDLEALEKEFASK